MPFIDQEAIKAQMERVVDAYEQLGMTVEQQTMQIDADGDVHVLTVALIRDTAYKQVTEDLDTRQMFNSQMVDDADARIKARAQAISDAVSDPDRLDALVRGEGLNYCETNHARVHEGLCLDCQQEIPEDTNGNT